MENAAALDMKFKKRSRFMKSFRKYSMGYVFVAPLMGMLLLFSFYPFVYGIYLSFTETVSREIQLIGLQNYRELFGDAMFWQVLGNLGKILVPKVIIGIVCPLIMAELIFSVRSSKTQNAYRIMILFPIVAPGVVSLLIWGQIFSVNGGMLNEILMAFGMKEPVDWLGDPKYVLFSIVFYGFPWIGGTGVLIYLSGLMNITTEMIEASRLDGCGTFRRIFLIDLPLILGQIRYFLVFGIINNVQDYGAQYVLIGEKAIQNLPEGNVPGYYMYLQAFAYNRPGYAATIGVSLFLIIAVVTAVSYKAMNRKVD